ncbi:MAG: transcriptional regulator MraZ [Chloroflexi bacterium]|jgi:MraZ protein|uniref:Transcriptional regulator MraZ n=1 Tax=Candidatus Thermofonsia Clade 3 bacterium TaxID=2364212 RepID=A0A2M8QDF9_9CHLR|nr:division/cell wall cluster transcriptional repressor MraZ [Candidatus Roseilinea sp. NK_OTU-006]PJF47846.1 MAG: cell division/cell wall cluster transcriptional repressor MraZ [Candidatus Thermofonsia Clade 3 bacterium]RMG63564.1 MAG: transcriptional regulator MraZ [Chloroflexota bacterium]
MFLGEFTHSLDEKSRLTLPAKFRARLANGLVMTTGTDKCLLIYPLDEFKLLFERVSALPVMGREAATLRRMLYSNAHDAVPDKQNRVVIPQPLREYAEITNEAVVVGVGKFIEVWNPREWQRALEEVRAHASQKEMWAGLGI